jgi:hypothetical protein
VNVFAQASGLTTKMRKTECYPIQCASTDLNFLNEVNLLVSHFPCKYLGLPLQFRKPSRTMLQPIIQKIGSRLPGWKRNFLSYPGRELLVKSVLSVMPTFFLTVFKMSKYAYCRINKFRMSFLWKGEDPDRVRGGYCLVNW